MEVTSRINEIEQELRRRGISIARLCRGAELAQTSWNRWKAGTIPTDEAWNRVEAAFAVLTAPITGEAA